MGAVVLAAPTYVSLGDRPGALWLRTQEGMPGRRRGRRLSRPHCSGPALSMGFNALYDAGRRPRPSWRMIAPDLTVDLPKGPGFTLAVRSPRPSGSRRAARRRMNSGCRHYCPGLRRSLLTTVRRGPFTLARSRRRAGWTPRSCPGAGWRCRLPPLPADATSSVGAVQPSWHQSRHPVVARTRGIRTAMAIQLTSEWTLTLLALEEGEQVDPVGQEPDDQRGVGVGNPDWDRLPGAAS